jgi:hypothetical protein
MDLAVRVRIEENVTKLPREVISSTVNVARKLKSRAHALDATVISWLTRICLNFKIFDGKEPGV